MTPMKHFFYVVSFKLRKMNKSDKTVVEIQNSLKVFLCYPLRGNTANDVNFMLPILILCSCYFSSLEGMVI